MVPRHALSPRGKNGPLLTLAANGTAYYTILVSRTATNPERKAAEVLSDTLYQMTGATFKTQMETGSETVSSRFISLGDTNLLRRSAAAMARQKLGAEGYAIDVEKNTLFLTGGAGRGPVNAALALLEEDLGCRWYAIGTSDIPRISKLAFRPVIRVFTPKLEIRDPFYFDAFDVNWSLHNRTNSILVKIPTEWGGSTSYAFNQIVHTYERDIPAGEFFATHPEYFALVNGKRQPTQLCVTNPDVLRITIERLKKFLGKNPTAKYVGVSPNDGRGFCDCPNCKAIDEAQGTRMGSLLQFVNSIADSLAVDYPDLKITTNAYTETVRLPRTIRPRKNVVIELCTDTHAWRYLFLNLTETSRFREALQEWKQTGSEIHVWDYTMNYVHYLLPMPVMPVVNTNINFLTEQGVKGLMLQGKENASGASDARMQCWVWAKQLWDPSRDTKSLMRDFTFGYYKEAAEPIWRYQENLWNVWEKYHAQPHTVTTPEAVNPIVAFEPCSYRPDGPLLSPDFVSESMKLLDLAAVQAKNPETLKRVQIARLPILYTALAQALGYFEEFRGYKIGAWIESEGSGAREPYRKMLAEFETIVKDQGVSSFSEMNGSLIGRWHALLDSAPLKPEATAKLQPSIVANGDNTERLTLGAVWKFKTDPGGGGLIDGWNEIATSEADWQDLRIDSPRGWDDQGFSEFRGYGWYRHRFELPNHYWQAAKIILQFDGVDEEAVVFVNGRRVFEHSSRSTGLNPGDIENRAFAFDVKPFLRAEGTNLLAVRVYNRVGIGGINKPVSLLPADS